MTTSPSSDAAKGDSDDSKAKASASQSPQHELSWGQSAIILIRDLICVHRLLQQESGKEMLAGDDMSDLSSHLFTILDKGHEYEFPQDESKPESFWKGQKAFLDDLAMSEIKEPSTQSEAVYSHSLDFVSSVVRDCFHIETEDAKEKETTEQAHEQSEPNVAQDASKEISPLPHDILLLMRGASESKLTSQAKQSGNERLLSLVDQYVSTYNEKDRLSTLSSKKRAQAALAIIDLAKESEGGKKGDPTNVPARFLVATATNSEKWREINRTEAAETTVILLFEKFLERDLDPWGIHTSELSSEENNAQSPQEDFSKAGTIPIPDPAARDVLFGRGGLTNNHPGNRRFRDIISLHRPDYVNAIKIEKPNVARRIVKAIRAGAPPGRFLKKNPKDGKWYDVGDKNATEKTSQALREKFKSRHQSPGKELTRGAKRPHEEEMSPVAISRSTRIRANEPNGTPVTNATSTPQSVGVANMHGMAHMAGSQPGPYSLAIRTRMSNTLNGPPLHTKSRGKNTAERSTNEGGTPATPPSAINSALSDQKKSEQSDSVDLEKEEPNPVDDDGNIVVTDHDILCGRGGLTNHHRGNKRFRDIVALHRPDYVRAPKVLKPNVARLIVRAIRNGDPPGRFLKKDDKSGLWYEISDKQAAEKASQALREKVASSNQPTNVDATTLLAPRPAQVPFFNMNPSMMAGMLPTTNSSMVNATLPKDSAEKVEQATGNPSDLPSSPPTEGVEV